MEVTKVKFIDLPGLGHDPDTSREFLAGWCMIPVYWPPYWNAMKTNEEHWSGDNPVIRPA